MKEGREIDEREEDLEIHERGERDREIDPSVRKNPFTENGERSPSIVTNPKREGKKDHHG